jgi:hypothetical protein
MEWWQNERSRHGGVDEIPLPIGPGRLWLCGKHFVGPDPEVALQHVGADVIVCLNERAELAPRYPDYVAWLDANVPDRAVWRPIPDLHAPAIEVLQPWLAELRERLASGHNLLMHCGAGVGRAGTVAAALLITAGMPIADALAVVAGHRPSAGPQTVEQQDLLALLTD